MTMLLIIKIFLVSVRKNVQDLCVSCVQTYSSRIVVCPHMLQLGNAKREQNLVLYSINEIFKIMKKNGGKSKLFTSNSKLYVVDPPSVKVRRVYLRIRI